MFRYSDWDGTIEVVPDEDLSTGRVQRKRLAPGARHDHDRPTANQRPVQRRCEALESAHAPRLARNALAVTALAFGAAVGEQVLWGLVPALERWLPARLAFALVDLVEENEPVDYLTHGCCDGRAVWGRVRSRNSSARAPRGVASDPRLRLSFCVVLGAVTGNVGVGIAMGVTLGAAVGAVIAVTVGSRSEDQ